MHPVFTVVIPAFNEEEVIMESYRRLTAVMKGTGESYELLFVDDGSKDKTAFLLGEAAEKDKNVKCIRFSRNFGHMAAITAGLDCARGDAIMIIDADLQDPPEVFPEMIAKWREGYDVVYGQRSERKGETAFKKLTANIFYRFIRSMTDVDMPVDTGEFRLIDRKVCEAIKKMREKSRYIRGLVSWVGFRQTPVSYIREKRFAGQTKYPLTKMISFAMDAITTFSYKPLKAASTLGFSISMLSFFYLIVVLCQRLFFSNTTISGWASMIAIVTFSQGIVLMVLGLMGEYIGRIFDEIKDRPIYLIQEFINEDEDK
ncbi:MAG: glycosyltransferase family 2 protein [Clostridiales bacterium]|jgi:dolichol-phosphate mannosyltransferase|nr:glycosyltransferase family 2 protein [Clostridiales bacterium]